MFNGWLILFFVSLCIVMPISLRRVQHLISINTSSNNAIAKKLERRPKTRPIVTVGTSADESLSLLAHYCRWQLLLCVLILVWPSIDHSSRWFLYPGRWVHVCVRKVVWMFRMYLSKWAFFAHPVYFISPLWPFLTFLPPQKRFTHVAAVFAY